LELHARLTSLNAEVALYRHALELSRAELQAFAYTVSHDLRAPIRAIEGFSRILMDDFSQELGSEAKNFLGHIVQNTRQLASQVDDLLKFYRLGKTRTQKTKVDCEALVREVLSERAEPISGEVTVRALPVGTVTADPHMLRQAFAYLIDNAIKFSRSSATPKVEVGCRNDGNATTFYVKDNGVGFDMQYAGQLFQVFQKLHSPQEYPGNGIGLAMVKRIAEMHGGCVAAESQPEKGAVFYLTLPATSEEEEGTGSLLGGLIPGKDGKDN
jgi:light-regulated signal transduction histidine kinase (bacteriophytochrome)